MLKCPKCGSQMLCKGKPVQKYTDRVMRYRYCTGCGKRFISHEVYEWDYEHRTIPEWIVKEQPAARARAKKKIERKIMDNVCANGCFNCPVKDCIRA